MPKREPDPIANAIHNAQAMLTKLARGLTTGEPLEKMELLARDIAVLTAAIEALVTASRLKSSSGPRKTGARR